MFWLYLTRVISTWTSSVHISLRGRKKKACLQLASQGFFLCCAQCRLASNIKCNPTSQYILELTHHIIIISLLCRSYLYLSTSTARPSTLWSSSTGTIIFLMLTCQWQTQLFTCDEGVSQSGGYAYSVIIGFFGSYPALPIQGDSITTTNHKGNECVYGKTV